MYQELRVIYQPKLPIRTTPNIGSPVVKYVPAGDIIRVIDIQDVGTTTWYKLEDNSGWGCGWNPNDGNGVYLELVNDLESQGVTPSPIAPNITISPGVAANNSVSTSQFSSQLSSDSTDISTIEALSNIPTSDESDDVQIHSYLTDYSFVEDNLKKIRKNINFLTYSYKELSNDLFHKFNRFKIAFPDYHLSKTFAHVFFTRPDLNIVDYQGNGNYSLNKQVQNEPVYYYLFKNNPDILTALTSSFSSEHDFHPFLSNTVQSFELSDEYIKTMEHGETFTGYKVQYGKSNIESKSAGSISLTFTDDVNFTIYKSIKAWVDYISKVYRGELSSKDEYIREKILDYACSVYYILCGPDGSDILFWSKYFGLFPTNIPSSSSSWSKGNLVKLPEYNINFVYAFKEDFSPLSLAEFNMNSRGNLLYKKIYEKSNLGTGKTFSRHPFIDTNITKQGDYIFKLRFRE